MFGVVLGLVFVVVCKAVLRLVFVLTQFSFVFVLNCCVCCGVLVL